MTDKAPTTDIVERLAFLAAHVADDGTIQESIDHIELRLERLPKHVPERCDDNRGEG